MLKGMRAIIRWFKNKYAKQTLRDDRINCAVKAQRQKVYKDTLI